MTRAERSPYRKSTKRRANEGALVTLRTYEDIVSAETDRASLEGAGIVGQIFRKKLERYAAFQPRVLGLVYHAHAAAANTAENTIVRYGFADHFNPLILTQPPPRRKRNRHGRCAHQPGPM